MRSRTVLRTRLVLPKRSSYSLETTMNVRFLIDRLVQHQAVLLAEVATSGGVRAPLSELGDQIFIRLAEELDRRGVSRKVSADMFGMALRAYLKKIQRLAESSTDRGTSLWEAVLAYVHGQQGATRVDVLQRFCRDDEAQVRAVLHDLVENGLVQTSGSGPKTLYEVESLEASRLSSVENFAELLWLVVFREGPIRRDDLLQRSGRRRETAERALDLLVETGRVSQFTVDGEVTYESGSFVVLPGQEKGWEAAILDHYQSIVGTISRVLRGIADPQSSDERNGGFTYTFDVWDGHPLENEVEGTLSELRNRLSELRARVDAENQKLARPIFFREIVVYGGQHVREKKGRSSSLPPPPENDG